MTEENEIPIGRYATRIEITIEKVTVDFLPSTYDELNSLIAQHHTSALKVVE